MWVRRKGVTRVIGGLITVHATWLQSRARLRAGIGSRAVYFCEMSTCYEDLETRLLDSLSLLTEGSDAEAAGRRVS